MYVLRKPLPHACYCDSGSSIRQRRSHAANVTPMNLQFHQAAIALLTSGRCLLATLVVMLSSSLAPETAFAAGRVIALSGKPVVVSVQGRRRALSLNAEVVSGETVETGSNGRVTVRFDDGARFSLGRRARFKIDRFAGQKAAKPSLSLRILRGAFRFVSGLIARRSPRSVSLRLGQVATIGIRGTVVGGEVNESAQVVLLEPEDPSRQTAIEVFNDAGSVIIDEPGFGTDIADANTAPTPPRRMRIRTVENLTRTIRNVGRLPRVRR